MNNPGVSIQKFGSALTSEKEGSLARVFPFKTTANAFNEDWKLAAAGDFVLGDFKSGSKSDRKPIDYVILGVLSIVLHASVVDWFNQSRIEEEEFIEPVKIPPKVQISFVRPQPKPIVQPPPPPPKVVAIKKPPKPKVKPKPAPKLIEPPPVPQAATVTESEAPVVSAPPAPKPVEEKITEPLAGADYLNNPSPEYPEIAMDRGWEGKVLMKVHVLASGKPDSVSVFKSSGRTVLDEAAVTTVKKWSFVPAMRGKSPIAGWVTVPISFNLQG
ncbi:MAG: energy transducer TonB [Methylobacter sp.]|nr:energy transducer TonB [Methylobacter sp.]